MTRDEFNRACAVPGRLIKAFAEARAEMAERIERGGRMSTAVGRRICVLGFQHGETRPVIHRARLAHCGRR
jgi:hypothetical protein